MIKCRLYWSFIWGKYITCDPKHTRRERNGTLSHNTMLGWVNELSGFNI